MLAIAEKEEGVESVSSLAGFEILSEGTSANSGSCLINLKDWKHRKRTAKEIIEDLEDKCKVITTANIDSSNRLQFLAMALPVVLSVTIA